MMRPFQNEDMNIFLNDKTKKMGRHNRFLIDDPESPHMLAYVLSKPLKLGWSFNNYGVYKFVLQEVTTTDDDNQELCIADYYKHFPRTSSGDGTEGGGSSSGGGTPSSGGDSGGNENGSSGGSQSGNEPGAGGNASGGEERTVWL